MPMRSGEPLAGPICIGAAGLTIPQSIVDCADEVIE
jgi:hypothetical protein